MPQDEPAGLIPALSSASDAFRERMSASGYTLEAFARIAVLDDRDAYVVATTAAATIPAEHRKRLADAAAELVDGIDRRITTLEGKLGRAERITGELAKLATLQRHRNIDSGRTVERILEQIDRLVAALELDTDGAA